MKITVLGAAGGIGQALSLLLKMKLPAGFKLALYDVAPVTPGIAVDLSHIPTDVKITGFAGEDATPALEGADIVLISAGVARKPGMDRSDPDVSGPRWSALSALWTYHYAEEVREIYEACGRMGLRDGSVCKYGIFQ